MHGLGMRPLKQPGGELQGGQGNEDREEVFVFHGHGLLSLCGRVVLRPSGTEPVVRVTVEAEDAAQVERLVRRLAAVVESSA